MSGRDQLKHEVVELSEQPSGADLLRPLVEAPRTLPQQAGTGGVVIGELIGFRDEGCTPLVLYSGQPDSAAIAARSIVDLDGAQIGRKIVLMFERADAVRPIIMGVLREGEGAPIGEHPDHVEVDVDGERLLVTAKEQLVLRCGKASITLTRAGKVLIQGSYVLSRSSGVNRVKGGSVQLN